MSQQFDGVVFLSRVRLSFPHLAVARAPQGSDKKKYSADLILLPTDPMYKKFVDLAMAAAQAKWPQHHAAILQSIWGDRKRRCFGQGSEKIDTTTYKVLNGYEGMVFISAARQEEKGMPQIIGSDNQAITNPLEAQNEARRMYGGCYVNAVVKPWIYDNNFGKGIGGDLIAIQFAGDGAPFGEGITDASAMFAGAQVAPPMPGAAPMGAPGMPGTPPGGWAAPTMPGAPFPGVQQPAMPQAPFPMPGAAPAAFPGMPQPAPQPMPWQR